MFYFTGENALTNLAAVVTILSLGISSILYFVKRWHDTSTEKRRASKNLYTELDDALDGLDEKIYTNDLRKIKLNDKDYAYFMNRRLNHDFYDSLIFSGKINFLKSELQQSVQDIFQIIKDHNFYLKKIRDIEDNARVGDDISSITKRYYEQLDKDEKSLLERIPKMKEKLKKEFKIK